NGEPDENFDYNSTPWNLTASIELGQETNTSSNTGPGLSGSSGSIPGGLAGLSDADFLRLYDGIPAAQLDDWIHSLSPADRAALDARVATLDRNQARETEYASVAGEFVTNLGGGIDNIQVALDVAGVVPLIGEVADAANGLISLARGDTVGAGLSFASMIPIWGDAL